MKVKSFALTGLGGSLLVAGVASAAFTQLTLETFVGAGWVENGYGATGLVTYRLYADFDGAGDDGVLSVFGIGGAPMSANSSDGAFHNDLAFGGLTAPLNITPAIWTNQWDTYVTINATQTTFNGDPDATGTSPGFATETNNLASNWSTTNAGWFVTPDDAQSMAIDNRVFLAQFSVSAAADATVNGKVGILFRDGNQVEGLLYPAPGALALLGLAGLSGTRRRRR